MDAPNEPEPVTMKDVVSMFLHAVLHKSDTWCITSIRPNTFEIKARRTNQRFTVVVEESK